MSSRVPQRIVTANALSVAKEMMNFFMMEGLTEHEAKERFWLIDTKVSALPHLLPVQAHAITRG